MSALLPWHMSTTDTSSYRPISPPQTSLNSQLNDVREKRIKEIHRELDELRKRELD